ncbi:MAG: tandem-95 repeat protein [Holophagaceae bacterium]|nr:tandem-95 repeat protein [Holophagaceae bacterium]
MNPFWRQLSFCALGLLPIAPLAAQVPLAPGVRIAHPDHYEFDAVLWAPFVGERGEARTLKMGFDFVNAETGTVSAWRLELLDAKGRVRRVWHGESFLAGGKGTQSVAWDGADAAGRPLERGFYTLRVTARPMAQAAYRLYPGGNQLDRVEAHLSAPETPGLDEIVLQETTVCVGPAPRLKAPAPALSPAGPRAAAAPGSAPAPAPLPYTVYLGNLHSQTNHSDGGVVVANCTGGENPQSGTQGPTEAYEMMRTSAGGDYLATTEHNHMYDGSTGTNTAQDPAVSNALFNSGLSAASAYRTAHASFMALYGVEWGVISNGGHLNIFNPDVLPTWEYNGSGQLLGGVFTAKSDYPALYATMQTRGWIGQFNHPQASQFNNLAFTAAGDEVMYLCEVSNSGAFSTSLTESDPFLSSYEIAYKAILEKGFHVAPTSNQDNHCANWGLSNINRTGLLVPNATPWSLTAMLDAIRARRSFATQDKGSQLVLTTSGGALMGDRINNGGSLTLQAAYATTTPGRSASRIEFYEGVPGTAFSTVQLIEGTFTATFTPAAGNHYYYAKVTQDDGRFLWSAPIWVNQAAGAVVANITQPASNTTVLDGATVNFTGTATTVNTAITGHSWNFGDGSPLITGTATPSHLFNNAGASPVVYTVTYTATDDTAATGQASRLITVQPAGATNSNPTISDIPNQSTLKDTPVNNLGFTIGDVETNANLLTPSATSSNQTLLPDANITFGGSGTGRTITLVPAADQTGTATVTVTVTDGAGATATDTFLFTVSLPGGPAGKVIISQYYEGAGNDKYIEITNVGGTPVDLAAPQLFLIAFNNANADTPDLLPPTGTPLALSGTLAAGASKVFRSSATGPAPVLPTYVATDPGVTATAVCNFNGDDLVILGSSNSLTNGVAWAARIDVIGDGTSWGQDRSYYRKPTVLNPNATYNLAAEWNLADTTAPLSLTKVQSATNTQTEYLGKHLFNLPASISDISGQSIEANQQAGPIAFTVGGTGTLTVTATSSNPTLLLNTGILLTGTGTDTARTITATPVADQVGTATVTVTVTDGNASTATDTFLLTVTDPVSTVTGVTVSPLDPTVAGLSTTTFTATVTGTGSYSQAVNWSASGGSINAAGQWTAPNTAGPFTITATSVQNGAVSGSSSVSVTPINTNPTISDITNKTTVQDTAIVDIPFTVGDAETPAASLVPTASSSNTALIPNANLVLGGSGASRTLTVTPAAGQTGSATITVTVTDGGLATATDTFLVTVTPPPSKIIISQYYEGATGTNKWLEITNVGTSAVNLGSPQLYLAAYQNAAAVNPAGATPNGTFTLTGTLNPGQSMVLRNSATALPAYPLPGSVVATSVTQFNGDDLVILTTLNSGAAGVVWAARLDVVGQGGLWGPDTSIHRKPSILGGNTAFNLAAEWDARTLAQADTAANTVSEFIGVHLFGTAPSISDLADLTVDMGVAIPGIPFTVNDAETNPDNLVFTLSSSNTTLLPNAGITVSGTGTSRTLNLAPAPGQRGTATVTVSIKDGGNMVASDTFVLTVNAAPVAADQSVSTNEDTGTAVTLGATDADANPLTYTVVGNPLHGTLSGTAPNLTYTPFANYFGPDSFTFTANDGRLDSNAATVSITVNPVNDPPVAVNDAYPVVAGSSLAVAAPGVLGNDTDVDGPALSAALVAGPAHGTLVLAADGSFTYVPDPVYAGPDAFTYQASDGSAASNVATVTLTVSPAGAPAVSSFAPASGPVGTVVTLTGSNFPGLSAVKFNGVAAAFTVLSPTQVRATVPAGATTGPITVANALGSTTTPVAFTVTGATGVPRITSFSPTSGPVGTVVTIAGLNFTGATAVTFNGISASFLLVSGTKIKATVPAGATTGPIAVTGPSGTGTTGSVKFTVR